jgi:hypothetical protein
LDEFEWGDLVRWHVQHQRVTGEQAQFEITRMQLTQLSTLSSMLGGARQQPPQQIEQQLEQDDGGF